MQIGCHSDRLWGKDAWRRAPEIVHRVPLKTTRTQIASGFGGLVYLVVPRNCRVESFEATVSGAVESPRFKLGETDDAAWRKQLRFARGPWAELEGAKVIITVPSAACRNLKNPTELMRFWDDVLDACADLATWPRERERPERIVVDEQISAGYMHSGHPVMMHMDVAEVLVDLERIKTNGHGGVWGFFHELGHNHQSGDWTFDGTGEVTVNLFTMYVYDTLLGGFPKDRRLDSPSWRKQVDTYFREGASFENWKQRPFLALVMYMQLQEAFGWDAYKRVFAEYRDLPKEERPKDDAEKRDRWMIRFSKTVGKNLGPFFRNGVSRFRRTHSIRSRICRSGCRRGLSRYVSPRWHAPEPPAMGVRSPGTIHHALRSSGRATGREWIGWNASLGQTRPRPYFFHHVIQKNGVPASSTRSSLSILAWNSTRRMRMT